MDNVDPQMATQIELERLYSKNQLIPRIRAEFQSCTEINFQEIMSVNDILPEFGWDVLIQMSLHKRANVSTLVGTLYHHFNDAQLTADNLLKAVDADLMDWSESLKLFITKFNVGEHVQRELDLFQYPLPMVVDPLPIENNLQSGYVLNNSSVILNNGHHDGDVVLDHLNLCNQVKLSINTECLKVLNNKWKNLDKPKDGETQPEFHKRKTAFAKFNIKAKEVMDILIEHGNEFRFTHAYDRRGRTYPKAYYISSQGNSYQKAMLEFYNKELVT